MVSSSPSPGGLSLFPSPNSSKPPAFGRTTPGGRRSESRERRAPTPQNMRSHTPQQGSEAEQAVSPPRQGRSTAQHRRQQTPLNWDGPQTQDTQHMRPQAGQHSSQDEIRQGPPQPYPQPQPHQDVDAPIETQPRPFRSSIAKLPLDDEPSSSHQQPLRSIFPTYNPQVPLDQQDYAPTQKSPTHIPRAIISRQSYYQNDDEPADSRSPQAASPRIHDENHRWAKPKPQEPPVIPKTSTTEQLKSFWKVANGWPAPSSEGKVYCMKLSQERDAPVYTLSSATDPFYNVRLDPTSASAIVTVKRHDPNKPYKEPKQSARSSSTSLDGRGTPSSGRVTDGKDWHEALATTLEEESRKHQPEDGLVAMLSPSAATKMAVEKSHDPAAVAMAEHEAARLVWDDDSENYFLVHPALATPFCVTIERSPAWSRVEYTLEHHESPKHLAKLTRDGTGGGWLEIDTGLASKIESFYIVDVAVTALMLVASADEKNLPVASEPFDGPPIFPPTAVLASNHSRSKSSLGKLVGGGSSKKKSKMEAFEIDVESQDDSLAKERVKIKEGIDKLPFLLRVPAKIVKGLFKVVIWVLTITFKCLKVVFGSCYKLVGSKY